MIWKNKYNKSWRRVFAFIPTNVEGTTIWFGFYEERYVEKGKQCDCGCQCNFIGGHERRLIERI